MSAISNLFASDALPEWQERANCDGTDTDAFYPEKGQTPWTALRICAGCDVRPECLQWALDRGEPGVWGGTTERERRRIRAGQAKAAAA